MISFDRCRLSRYYSLMRLSELQLQHKALAIALLPIIAALALAVGVSIPISQLKNSVTEKIETENNVDLAGLLNADVAHLTALLAVYRQSHDPTLLVQYDWLAAESHRLLQSFTSQEAGDHAGRNTTSFMASFGKLANQAIADCDSRRRLEELQVSRLRRLALERDSLDQLNQMRKMINAEHKQSSSSISLANDLFTQTEQKLLIMILVCGGALSSFLNLALKTIFVDRIKRLNQVSQVAVPPIPSATPTKDAIDALDHSLQNTVGRYLQSAELLKASQSRLQLLMERMPAGLMVLDAQGRIKFSNPAMEQLLESSQAEVIGQPLTKFFSEPSGQTLDFDQLRSKATLPVALNMNVASGRCSRVELTLDALDGETISFIAIVMDMSERHRWTQTRDRFTSMLAHDIAAPLVLINDMLNRHMQVQESELVSSAYTQSKRLLRMFDELLRAGSTIIDEEPLSRSTVMLKAMLRECIAAVSVSANNREIDVVLVCDEFKVSVDVDRFARVVINLLTNALKHSPDGGIVTVLAERKSDGFFELSIIDEGPGIQDGMQKTIFDAYRQTAEGRAKEGSGLGLAICAKIVAMHNGTIEANNNEHRGACFRIKQPIGLSASLSSSYDLPGLSKI
jgi:PAS domain S-box-containing protein